MTASKQAGPGWSTGKILAVVIPVCLVVAAVAVTLIIVLSKDNTTSTSQTTAPEAPTREEVVAMYDKIEQETASALKEMQDLESQEAMASYGTYEQEVAQAEADVEQLNADIATATASVEQAAADVSTAAGEATETQQEYQALLNEINGYYAYVEDLAKLAFEQVQYVKSTLPALEEIDGMKQNVTEVQSQPAQARARQLETQLAGRSGRFSSRAKPSAAAPQSLKQYSTSLDALAVELGGLSTRMAQALGSRNLASFNDLANQMNASVAGTFGQLSGGLTNSINGFTSQLSSFSGKVDAAMPKK